MKLQNIILEGDYDKLNMYQQMKYFYCDKCNYYYLAINERKHLCGSKEVIR